jgi:hypothetical protein
MPVEEDKKSKIKRLAIWAVFIIALGFIGAMYIPNETYSSFIDLLKDVITHLVI